MAKSSGRLSDVAAIQSMPSRRTDDEHFSMHIRPIEGGHIVHTSRSCGDHYESSERFVTERPHMPDLGSRTNAGEETISSAVKYLNRK